MLQVYDRVLVSRSVPTLVGLSIIAVLAFLLQGFLDGVRGWMLARIGALFDRKVSERVYEATTMLPLKGVKGAELLSPVRDLDQIRSFLSGLGPTALFDLPFMPVFLFVAFMLHPWLGILTLTGALLLVALTLITERRSLAPARAMAEVGAVRHNLVEAMRRNAEALRALGMRQSFSRRFAVMSQKHVEATLQATDVTGKMGAIAKVIRMILQSAALGVGAYLVIKGEMSAGAIIAATIITSRALAPVETAVAHWRGFIAARMAYRKLSDTLALLPPDMPRLPLPAPRRDLVIDEILCTPPGRPHLILNGVSLKLEAGDALGLIGPTGCGKSSLARAIVGVWPTAKGDIRIDGATLDQWGDMLGNHIGYLPQDVELFQGTVAENISRFQPSPDPAMVIAAAEAAGAHQLILELSNGYETMIGETGASLSGGQRQRIALARALYGDPFLVVLDEPNANLDHDGDSALSQAIRNVKERKGIVVIITHRPSGLAAVDKVAVMKDGKIKTMGPRDTVMQSMMQPAPRGTPVSIVPAPIAGNGTRA
jgi:ATP-binding cassette subfamily C protein